jgi:prenylcysteine oxidase/farnesylcysteine lyase
MGIEGGNWQIFHNMATNSTKDIRLETAVTALSKQDDATYILKSKTSSLSPAGEIVETSASATFDSVILAAPYQYTSIDVDPVPPYLPDEIPYVNLHVTLFTSPHALVPEAFNLKPEDTVPQVVLTTLLPSEHPGTTPIYPGKAGFYSISTLRTVTNPKTKKEEFVYKIFSPAPVSPEFLSRILGINATDSASSTTPHPDFHEKDVSWLYRKLWQSYPYEYPRQTFEELRLDENFWYTSGIESFISTMETSALMGMNVARLIVDEWIGGRHQYFVESLAGAPPKDDESSGSEGMEL